jgi:hypothetical protein
VTADCRLRPEQSSHPPLRWSPSTTPAIHASTVARIAIVIKAQSHPGQAAASRDSSARGIAIVRLPVAGDCIPLIGIARIAMQSRR